MRSPLKFSGYSLIAANLVPLVMAALGYWGVNEILTLYWTETGIVGLFTVLKVLFAAAPTKYHKPLTFAALKSAPAARTLPLLVADLGFLGKILLSVFFAFPFVLFMILQALLLYLMLSFSGLREVSSFLDLKWGLLALLISHGVAFTRDYLATGDFRRTRPEDCMQTPFHRLAIMQLTLAAGAGLSRSFSHAVSIMMVFVVAKIVIDLRPPEGYIGGSPEPGDK